MAPLIGEGINPNSPCIYHPPSYEQNESETENMQRRIEVNEADVTLEVTGSTLPGKEHTIILKYQGKQCQFYCDGYEGPNFKEIKEILEVLGIHPFEVHKS
jgi:hypothetical protein